MGPEREVAEPVHSVYVVRGHTVPAKTGAGRGDWRGVELPPIVVPSTPMVVRPVNSRTFSGMQGNKAATQERLPLWQDGNLQTAHLTFRRVEGNKKVVYGDLSSVALGGKRECQQTCLSSVPGSTNPSEVSRNAPLAERDGSSRTERGKPEGGGLQLEVHV